MDYKKEYGKVREELDDLKSKLSNNKGHFVDKIHKKLGLIQDIERDRFLSYGHFLWKLNMDELIYIDKIIFQSNKKVGG